MKVMARQPTMQKRTEDTRPCCDALLGSERRNQVKEAAKSHLCAWALELEVQKRSSPGGKRPDEKNDENQSGALRERMQVSSPNKHVVAESSRQQVKHRRRGQHRDPKR